MTTEAQPGLIQNIPSFMVGRLLSWQQSKKPKHKQDKPRPCPLVGGYSVGY